MPKIFVFLFFVFWFVSCGEASSNEADTQDESPSLVSSALPKKSAINTKASAILKDWGEYNIFETSFDRVYASENREDLILVIEDLIEKQKLLEQSTYPIEFDIPQLKGRQKVLKTYILKTKGDLEYRVNPEASLKEMIQAFNIFREQFNVVVNNTLSEDLIINEKN